MVEKVKVRAVGMPGSVMGVKETVIGTINTTERDAGMVGADQREGGIY